MEENLLVNKWSNHETSSRITSAVVLNEDSYYPLLAISASDGSVRIWENPFTKIRSLYPDYGVRDPYFKKRWLDARSNTCVSKTGRTLMENGKNVGEGWKTKGSNLFIGNTYIGDNIGGFLGIGYRNMEPKDRLMGGIFSKGYGWSQGTNGASAASPSGAAPVPLNGWVAGSTDFLDPDENQEKTFFPPKMVANFTGTVNVCPGMKGILFILLTNCSYFYLRVLFILLTNCYIYLRV